MHLRSQVTYTINPSIAITAATPSHQKDTICCPQDYNSDITQSKIAKYISLASHQWIYNLECQPNEEIFINNNEWLLAKDRHPGADERYLIIYKDISLKTIRDLRQNHIQLLRDSYVQSLSYLKSNNLTNDDNILVFFHYYPSVFQLHAHITFTRFTRNQDRIHEFKHIIRNLRHCTHWYRDALILTRTSKILGCGNIRSSLSKWQSLSRNLMGIKPRPKRRLSRD